MTRRRVIGGVVLLAVVALAIWVSRNVYWAEVQVPTPLRGKQPTSRTQRGVASSVQPHCQHRVGSSR